MIEMYEKAGRIAAGIMEEAISKIEAGKTLLEIAEFVEKSAVERGAIPAFPCNISLNERAAHYTPTAGDKSVFSEGDLVKLDLGVHVDGYIADIARSVVVGGDNSRLIDAAEMALQNAIKCIKPGVKTNEVGRVIEDTITAHGYKPISNLTGHMLTRWNLHGGILVPNVGTPHGDTIKEGYVLAIEPFATDGAGRVSDEPDAIIYRYLGDRPLRMREARVILEYAKKNYRNLPFAERWISNLVPRLKLKQALRQLVLSKSIYAYHILREKNRGMVAQAEHTVIVTEDGCAVTTR